MTMKRRRSWRAIRRLIRSGLFGLAMMPAMVAAQGPAGQTAESPQRVEGPAYGRVSLMFSQYYDDNLFAVPNSQHPQSDLVSRFGPTFEVGRRSRRLDLTAKYGIAAERYVEQIALNSDVAHQDGGFDVRYNATPRLQLHMNGSYIDTLTPRELNTITLLNSGRTRAEQLRGQAGAVQELKPRLRLNLDYEVSNETLMEQPTNLSQSGRAGFEWRKSERTRYRLDGRVRHVRFAQNELTLPIVNTTVPPTTVGTATGSPSIPTVFGTQSTQAITGGVTYTLTPLTSVELDGGPRFSAGDIFPEFSGTVRRRMPKGELMANVTSTQDTAFGQPGFFDVKRVSAMASVSPTRHLTLRATPGYAQSKLLGMRNEVKELDVAITVRVLQRLSFVASGHAADQLGSFNAVNDPILSRHLALTTVLTLP